MVKCNNTKNVCKVLFEIEQLFFNTHNNYSENEITERWNIYTDIFNQLQRLNKPDYLHEIHYKTLVGQNINDILINIINKDDDMYVFFYPYLYALEEFLDFDSIKMFV